LCANGAHPELAGVQGATHDSAMAASYDRVNAWITDRLKGNNASGNCPP
jgi:hypothetical protein